MSDYTWADTFETIYTNAAARYADGVKEPGRLFTESEQSFLDSIGASAQEIFDFIDDHATWDGEPSFNNTLLITAARRDYFLVELGGVRSNQSIDVGSLPEKTAALEGIVWLPRIIEKAKAKLRGEMPPELMYSCGGDRAFCREHRVSPADFLRLVWSKWDDPAAIAAFVRARKEANGG